jgi:phage shock protein C
MNTPRTTLYRDKANAKLLGVCAGIADYTGISTFWVRLMMIALGFVMFPLNVIAYFVLGIVLDKKPSHLYVEPAEQKYWQGVRQSPKRTAREIRARMKDIDRRLADVETYYVSNNVRLSAEIERLR